jgi:hypothetical protein
MSSRPSRLAALAAVALVAAAGPARAETINISAGTGDPGAFTGSVSVTPTGATTATVVVTLTNTSPAANGGFITGFAFNDPSSTTGGNINAVTGFTQSYAPAGAPPANNLTLIGTDGGGNLLNDSISGSPFGNFDLGAAVGGSLLGDGAPQPGIEVNQTGTFTFFVTGTDMMNLSAASILGATTQGSNAAFMVRFRGFCDRRSDKLVIVSKTPPPPPVGAVPAPPAAVLAGVGVVCCLLGRSRRKTLAPAA